MHRRPARRGFTLVEVLVVVAIIGIMIALLLPALQIAREAARRTECRNHLKQMSLGVLAHESMHRTLPSAGWGFSWIGDPDRGVGLEQPGGWFYIILPLIEQKALLDIGKNLEGGSPDRESPKGQALKQLLATPVPIYPCPTRRPAQPFPNGIAPYNCEISPVAGKIDYAGNGGDNNIIDSTQAYQPRRFDQGDDPEYWKKFPAQTGGCGAHSQLKTAKIRDGMTNTYLMGEKYLMPESYYANGTDLGDNHSAYTGLNWDNVRTSSKAPAGSPLAYQPPQQDTSGFYNFWKFGSAHVGSFNMAYCDGSVHNVNYSIDVETYRKNCNRADGAVSEMP
jgi:prepilin-type N-terminal cleavage/methylation domain-containing protein/prepilin-type processing-associated H-X9-DG protein